MSRVGKNPVTIPQGVQVQITGQHVEVKGPKGTLVFDAHPSVILTKTDSEVTVGIPEQTKELRMLWGTTRALIANMVTGAATGFSKQLDVQGVGYKAIIQGKQISLDLGYTHPRVLAIPEGIQVVVERNFITVSGADKQAVGEFAAQIRKQRPPEPYKGKGIRYVGEYVIRKEGKRAGSEGAK